MFEPKNLQITPEMLSLVARIDEFKGSWRAIGALAPERLTALKRVATIESIGSSTRIEGNRLSDREVEALLSNLEMKSFASRDDEEVAGYADVMELVFSSFRTISFTENHVKHLHQVLLGHSGKDTRHRGQYKTHPNHVVAIGADAKPLGVVFHTASPFDTPRLMTELHAWFESQRAQNTLHPLLVIGIYVVTFLEIHPFQDGNGRISRALTTLLLLQAGYHYVPYSSLESVIELSKESYYLALRQTQASIRTSSPDWSPWLTFFLRALAEQVRRLETKVEREHQMIAPLPELSLHIVEIVREHRRITISEAARITGANRNTLKVHLRSLVERGILNARGGGRGAWYDLK